MPACWAGTRKHAFLIFRGPPPVLSHCARSPLQMRAMVQEVGGLQEENHGLQAAAEKAERHLNAYDKVGGWS